MSRQTGVALILVIMLTFLLAIIAIGFQQHSAQHLSSYEKQEIKSELRFALESELNTFIYSLSTAQNKASLVNTFKRYKQQNSDVEVEMKVVNYNTRLSLPNATPETLKNALSGSVPNVDVAADSYFDWIDEDNVKRANGWEKAGYANAGRSGPKNSQVTSLAELSVIHGFESTPLFVLEKLVTVYPTSTFDKVNATPELLSTFFSSDIVEEIVAARTVNDYGVDKYRQITGENVAVDFVPPIFTLAINIKVTKNGVSEKQSIDLKIAPFNSSPIEFYKVGQ